MRKRQTLETAIREILSDFPDSDRFDVYAFELWRDEDGGWSVNDGWRMESNADKETVVRAARGRWEVFKLNYMPRARVADLETDDNLPYCLRVNAGFTSFLEIRPVAD